MSYRIPVYARFQWINDRTVQKVLRKALPRHTRGRCGYDKLRLLLWLLYRQFMRCSYRDLESMTGIDHTTFIKFKRRLITNGWFADTFGCLSETVAAKLPSVTALIDSTFIETYSRHDEHGSGYSGYKEANGFKLHTLLDFRTRLPLVQWSTSGNAADITGGRYLVDHAPPSWNIHELCADRAYDCEAFVMSIQNKWAGSAVAIPVRRTNQKGDQTANRRAKYLDRSSNVPLYKRRTGIERYYSRKKGVFHLGDERTRGIENFTASCYLTSIMEYLEWIAPWALFSGLCV